MWPWYAAEALCEGYLRVAWMLSGLAPMKAEACVPEKPHKDSSPCQFSFQKARFSFEASQGSWKLAK